MSTVNIIKPRSSFFRDLSGEEDKGLSGVCESDLAPPNQRLRSV